MGWEFFVPVQTRIIVVKLVSPKIKQSCSSAQGMETNLHE